MSLQNSLNQTSPFGKMALLVALMMLGMLAAILFLLAINSVFFHLPLSSINSISSQSSLEAITAAKVMQIVSQIGLFVLPALGVAYITSNSVSNSLKTNKPIHYPQLILITVITLLSIPFINLLAQWNADWHLPESWNAIEQWMRQKQVESDNMMSVLVIMDTKSDIIINTIMIAILPAIGEELVFRGVIQPQLIRIFKNPHIGIILTAILFSAIHIQFLGFFSRAILGVLFGYIFYYSNNIKYPIIAHFINNFLALGFVFFYGSEIEESSFEDPYDLSTILVALGLFTFAFILFFITKPLLKTANKGLSS